MDSEKVDTHRNGSSADPKITPDPPAPQTNDKIRHEYTRLSDIIHDPRSTHDEQEDARRQRLRLQGRKTVWEKARESDPEPAAEVDAEPAPLDSERQSQKERQKARLTELLETKAAGAQEYNNATRTIHAKIAKIEDEQLPAPDEAERIDALIAPLYRHPGHRATARSGDDRPQTREFGRQGCAGACYRTAYDGHRRRRADRATARPIPAGQRRRNRVPAGPDTARQPPEPQATQAGAKRGPPVDPWTGSNSNSTPARNRGEIDRKDPDREFMPKSRSAEPLYDVLSDVYDRSGTRRPSDSAPYSAP